MASHRDRSGRNANEKARVARLLTDILGVTSVKNQMTVEGGMTK